MAATTLAPATSKAVVLFDGLCAFCQRSVRILRRLDVTGQLECRDVRDPSNIPPAASAVEPHKFLEQMHLVTPSGQIYVGFPAYRWMAGRLPVLMLIWPFLFLPGVPWLGQKAYLWVARNRFHLVPCHDGQCAVPLPKRR